MGHMGFKQVMQEYGLKEGRVFVPIFVFPKNPTELWGNGSQVKQCAKKSRKSMQKRF